jgi:hypothetical protein
MPKLPAIISLPNPPRKDFFPSPDGRRILDNPSPRRYPLSLKRDVHSRSLRDGRCFVKLEDITTDMVKKAIEIYVAAAYEGSPVPLTVKSRLVLFADFAGDDLTGMLSHEVVERVVSETAPRTVASYSVRLGNPKYPHMKLTLRRLDSDDFRFAVDAHDRHFELEPADSDALRAHELQEHNQRLKREIESRWRDADIPTVEES